MELAIEQLNSSEIYRLLVGAVQPRPIAWVCSTDRQNRLNLAPFSFFTMASVQPPVVAFTPLLKSGGQEKDTVRNIRQTEEFTLNVVSHSLAEAMNKTSAELPYGESEIDHAGLHPASSASIATPRIREAMIHFECRLHSILAFGDQPLAGRLVLGEVVHMQVADELYREGRIDQDKLDAVGRLAGNRYVTTRDQFSLPRPG